MTTPAQWLAGARPRTLSAAIAPICTGTGAADLLGSAHLGRASLALAVAVGLQISVNYANDYSDGVRGTDRDRLGPARLVASGQASAPAVRRAALLAAASAALCGLTLIGSSRQWWLLLLGAVCFPAAWGYTGGRRPYGYFGLGEVMVFIFFGLAAVLGTCYTQAGRISTVALAAAVGVGSYACAILVANNLRDIPTDIQSRKMTLAARLGDPRTRILLGALLVAPTILGLIIGLAHPWTLLALLAVIPAWGAGKSVISGAHGRELISVLQKISLAGLSYGALLGFGLFLS
jgi:1,4-dihydroxy-2-naphthoate polyprenyltransferase